MNPLEIGVVYQKHPHRASFGSGSTWFLAVSPDDLLAADGRLVRPYRARIPGQATWRALRHVTAGDLAFRWRRDLSAIDAAFHTHVPIPLPQNRSPGRPRG